MYISFTVISNHPGFFNLCGTIRLFSPLEGKFYVFPQNRLIWFRGGVDVIGKWNYADYIRRFQEFYPSYHLQNTLSQPLHQTSDPNSVTFEMGGSSSLRNIRINTVDHQLCKTCSQNLTVCLRNLS